MGCSCLIASLQCFPLYAFWLASFLNFLNSIHQMSTGCNSGSGYRGSQLTINWSLALSSRFSLLWTEKRSISPHKSRHSDTCFNWSISNVSPWPLLWISLGIIFITLWKDSEYTSYSSPYFHWEMSSGMKRKWTWTSEQTSLETTGDSTQSAHQMSF